MTMTNCGEIWTQLVFIRQGGAAKRELLTGSTLLTRRSWRTGLTSKRGSSSGCLRRWTTPSTQSKHEVSWTSTLLLNSLLSPLLLLSSFQHSSEWLLLPAWQLRYSEQCWTTNIPLFFRSVWLEVGEVTKILFPPHCRLVLGELSCSLFSYLQVFTQLVLI